MSKKEGGGLGKLYLTGYNAAQTAGWSLILAKSILFMVDNKCYKGAFENVYFELAVAQTGALLEVVHCMTGLVRANPFLTLVQILSRVLVFWGVLVIVPETRVQIGLPMLLIAWSIAEITRYLFYVFTLHDACPKIIVWCRYSFFLVLYPIGVLSEILCIVASLPYVAQRQIYTYSLPNKYNFSFDYQTFLVITLFTYLPGLPMLYLHMLKQRGKVLNPKENLKKLQ